jgi:flagellar biosynthesis component FlhA
MKSYSFYNRILEKLKITGTDIVLVVPMELRQVMSVVVAQLIPNAKVVAREEIACGYNLEIIERV